MSSGFSGLSKASALSAVYRSSLRYKELIDNNGGMPKRVFWGPDPTPPPLEDTLPTHLIRWPDKED